jgi:hypothetical protein
LKPFALALFNWLFKLLPWLLKPFALALFNWLFKLLPWLLKNKT